MSKGNMLFSMARGKVGDLVFSRLDGEQIVRSRNRHPNNPRTNQQLYQRAIMATVLRAYSAGKVIFDHSFEGKKVSIGNQRRFLSLNAKRLRAALAADLAQASTAAESEARLVGPGVTYPTPFTFQVSEGSLLQTLFNAVGVMSAAEADETVGAYCTRMGLTADDLFTVVVFNAADTDVPSNIVFAVNGSEDDYSKQTVCQFCFARLRIKAAALTDTTVITDATTLDAIFEPDGTMGITIDLSAIKMTDPIVTAAALPLAGGKFTSGVIRSRENQGLRSTCVLEFPLDNETVVSDWGIASPYILQAWAQGTQQVGDSDLILEGANF